MTFIVGLTGGIGSGKTLVSDHFSTLGVPVIDTDVIARSIVEPGQPTLRTLADEFGDHILTKQGELDRSALRTIAFSSATMKARLDAITHPAIREQTQLLINTVTYPYCIVVVPLLTPRSPFAEQMDRIIAVTADRETRIERVQARSGLTREEVTSIMDTQLSDQQRRAFADDIISNDSSIEHVYKQVARLHKTYLEAAA